MGLSALALKHFLAMSSDIYSLEKCKRAFFLADSSLMKWPLSSFKGGFCRSKMCHNSHRRNAVNVRNPIVPSEVHKISGSKIVAEQKSLLVHQMRVASWAHDLDSHTESYAQRSPLNLALHNIKNSKIHAQSLKPSFSLPRRTLKA